MKNTLCAVLTIALSAAMGVMLLDSALSSIEAREQAVTAAYVDADIQWAQGNKQ